MPRSPIVPVEMKTIIGVTVFRSCGIRPVGAGRALLGPKAGHALMSFSSMGDRAGNWRLSNTCSRRMGLAGAPRPTGVTEME